MAKAATPDYLEVLLEAWNQTLSHYRKLGTVEGYAHRREEDLRSLLFSKIFQSLERRHMHLLDVATEVELLPKKRIDILLGDEASESSIGIEIKRNKDIDDLEKLADFMNNKKIGIGAFVAIVKRESNHPYDKTEIGKTIAERYNLLDKDDGIGNYMGIENIVYQPLKTDWDAVLVVLRKLEKKTVIKKR